MERKNKQKNKQRGGSPPQEALSGHRTPGSVPVGPATLLAPAGADVGGVPAAAAQPARADSPHTKRDLLLFCALAVSLVAVVMWRPLTRGMPSAQASSAGSTMEALCSGPSGW